MRVVVTGGSGFIGSRLCRRLVARGDEVTVVDLVPARASGCRSVHSSVLDLDGTTRHVAGADVVVHLAGYVREGMRRSPHEGATLQLQGTLNVLEACRRAEVGHVALASSFYVYDAMPADVTVDESTPLDPRPKELFGAGKLMAEALCHEYQRRHGLDYTVFRLGAVYGFGGSSAVGDFIETGLRGQTIEVWGRGVRRNQYTYVDDIADGIIAGLARRNETYNLISPEATTTGQLAEMLAAVHGFRVRFDTDRPEGPSFPYMSAGKAVSELGWQPISLQDGVKATVEATAAESGHQPGPGGGWP
jgi:nucleoside-diphosphate-sugar epimerase